MEEQASDLVRMLRARIGMTQEEFAHALGLTVGTVNRWERRHFRPSKLARATITEFARRRGIAIEPTPVAAGFVEDYRDAA